MSGIPSWTRRLVGPVVLIVLLLALDPAEVLARLSSVHLGWAGLAVLIGIAQTFLSAWRWRYTAGRLGLDLPFVSALAEYYLAVFLNQVLPGGVLGDATRAWRHASRSGFGTSSAGSAMRAVLLERASGQLVMAFVALGSACVILWRMHPSMLAPLGAAGVLSALAAVMTARRLAGAAGGTAPSSLVPRILRDARLALWDGPAVVVQLTTSMLIVGSYVLTYLIAARAVGIEAPFVELAPLVAPVLLAMLIPLSIGGWGLREGAAAAMWVAVGMSAAEGVAISVAYGVIVLIGTLPGAWLMVAGGYDPFARGSARRSRSKSTSSPSAK